MYKSETEKAIVKKKKTIMLVDDDLEFLEELQVMLNLIGYKTKRFSRGEQALQSIKKVKPDLILLDLKMDGMSGFDFTKALQADPEIKNIPIIIVSAFCSEPNIELLKNIYKIKRIVEKPVKPLDIISKVEAVFSKTNKGGINHGKNSY